MVADGATPRLEMFVASVVEAFTAPVTVGVLVYGVWSIEISKLTTGAAVVARARFKFGRARLYDTQPSKLSTNKRFDAILAVVQSIVLSANLT